MAEPLERWIGKDEAEGIPVQPRKDVAPPPHWRLEAVVRTERPRSLALAADRRRAVFIQDGDTSDVWLLDLDEGERPVPRRLTAGRAPMPYWEDTEPRLSPDGAQVAHADEGHVHLVPAAGGPPRRLLEADAPVWVDARTLLVSIERDAATRLAVVDVTDPWPRRLATAHAELEQHGDEWGAAVSPSGAEVAFVFTSGWSVAATTGCPARSSSARIASARTGCSTAGVRTPSQISALGSCRRCASLHTRSMGSIGGEPNGARHSLG